MADLRALCAELVDELHRHTSLYEGHESELVARARAALAQAESQGPTDDDLAFLYYVHCDGSDAMGQVGFEDAARAVLARYGRPAVEPVPVNERLPGPEDCDAEGQVWGWYRDGRLGFWQMRVINERPKSAWLPTHWLPHWALPVPQQEAGQ